ncbi:hypothetical protein HZA96_01495 [Candidatus Woesearchaeota archaeon]|nr:hypothetical protein [Candidatus Woesearchaeota archaeon]
MKKEDKKAIIVLVLILIVLASYLISNPGVLSTDEKKEDFVGMAEYEAGKSQYKATQEIKKVPVGSLVTIKAGGGGIYVYKKLDGNQLLLVYVNGKSIPAQKPKHDWEVTAASYAQGGKLTAIESFPEQQKKAEPAEAKFDETSDETEEDVAPDLSPPEDTDKKKKDETSTPILSPTQKLSAAESTAKVEQLQAKVYDPQTKSLTVTQPDGYTITFTKTENGWKDNSGSNYEDTSLAVAISNNLASGDFTGVQLKTNDGQTHTVTGSELTFAKQPATAQQPTTQKPAVVTTNDDQGETDGLFPAGGIVPPEIAGTDNPELDKSLEDVKVPESKAGEDKYKDAFKSAKSEDDKPEIPKPKLYAAESEDAPKGKSGIETAATKSSIDQAIDLYEQGDYEGVKTIMETVVKTEPSTNNYFKLATALQALGENEKALDAYNKAKKLAKNDQAIAKIEQQIENVQESLAQTSVDVEQISTATKVVEAEKAAADATDKKTSDEEKKTLKDLKEWWQSIFGNDEKADLDKTGQEAVAAKKDSNGFLQGLVDFFSFDSDKTTTPEEVIMKQATPEEEAEVFADWNSGGDDAEDDVELIDEESAPEVEEEPIPEAEPLQPIPPLEVAPLEPETPKVEGPIYGPPTGTINKQATSEIIDTKPENTIANNDELKVTPIVDKPKLEDGKLTAEPPASTQATITYSAQVHTKTLPDGTKMDYQLQTGSDGSTKIIICVGTVCTTCPNCKVEHNPSGGIKITEPNTKGGDDDVVVFGAEVIPPAQTPSKPGNIEAKSIDNALEDMKESNAGSTIEVDGLKYTKGDNGKWTAKPPEGGTHTLGDDEVAQKCEKNKCNTKLMFDGQTRIYTHDPEAEEKVEAQTTSVDKLISFESSEVTGLSGITDIDNAPEGTTIHVGDQIFKKKGGKLVLLDDSLEETSNSVELTQENKAKLDAELKQRCAVGSNEGCVIIVESAGDKPVPKPSTNFDDVVANLDKQASSGSIAVVNGVEYIKDMDGNWVETNDNTHILTDQQMKGKCNDNSCKLTINAEQGVVDVKNNKPELKMPATVGADGSVTYSVGEGDSAVTYKVLAGETDVQICKGDKCEKCEKCATKGGKLLDSDGKPIGDSPEAAREKAEDFCVKNLDDKKCAYVAENLKNAVNIATAPFRAEVERIVGSYVNTLLDMAWIGSNRNFIMAMCGAKYYEKEGEAVGAFGGISDSWKTPLGYGAQDPVDAIYDGLLTGGSSIIKMSGTKEEITSEMYRYTARVLLIGNFEYTIYFQNSCTKESSAFEGGFVKQGTVQALGAPNYDIQDYRDYYSGSLTTFDCANGPCRFDQICVKRDPANDDKIENPFCVTLAKGKFRTKFKDGKSDEAGSVEC